MPLVGFRIFARQRRGNRSHVRLRSALRDAGFQSSYNLKQRFAAIAEGVLHFGWIGLFRHRGGHPEIGAENGIDSDELRRRDADDREQDVIQAQRSANDVVRSAEARLPGSEIDHRDRMRAGRAVFFWEKEPSFGWFQIQRVEVAGRNQLGEHSLGAGIRLPRQQARRGVAGQRLKRRILGLIIAQIQIGLRLRRARTGRSCIWTTRCGPCRDREQTTRVRHRERIQDQRVDQSEDGAVGADSERQRENHEGDE